MGTLAGFIRFDGEGEDRRGQRIRAGVYTLRYALMPRDEAHLGAAPRRDFLLLSSAEEDKAGDTTPRLDLLLRLSQKASGSAHPAVLSIRRADGDSPGFSQKGEDWVLQTKLGDTPIEVILVGTAGF